jgi:hypothetical protein
VKCGSSNTQIVGRLEDGKSLLVRCTVCGAHFTVVTHEFARAPFLTALAS